MPSIIMATAARYMFPLLLIFSFFLLLRGHYEPGGGFVGGLVAASAYVFYFIAFGVQSARAILKVSPVTLIAFGLCIALGSAIVPILWGKPFMTGVWSQFSVPILGKIGTPFIFDVGVYFLVLGIALMIIFSLAEEDTR